CIGVDGVSGLANETPDHTEGQPASRLAVAAGFGSTRFPPTEHQPDEQAGHCGATRVIGVEDLGEGRAEDGPWRARRPVGLDPFGQKCGIDLCSVQELVERQALGLTEGFDLFENAELDSLGHRRPPCLDERWIVYPPTLIAGRPTLVYLVSTPRVRRNPSAI